MFTFQRSKFLLAIHLWIAAACAGMGAQPVAFGQMGAGTGGGNSLTTFHLHGTVVDGVTGKPVERALVTSQDRRLATMTDVNGVFNFEIRFGDLPNGPAQMGGGFGELTSGPNGTTLRMNFRVQKPGYMEPERPLNVGFDGTTAEARFTILPAGAVSGHVFADAGATPRGVMVMLLAHNAVDGKRRWITVGTQRTEGDGAFRFSNLRPGEYTLMTAEWRGDQPPPSPHNVVGQEYPPVFFGDTSSLQSSLKLHVNHGEIAETNLHLRLTAYYPVKVPVSGPPNAGINVRVNSAEALDGFQLGYNGNDHAVEGALPSGTYTLTLASYRPQEAFATAVLHVASAPVQTSPVTLVGVAPVTVRIHEEYTASPGPGTPGSTRVMLIPEDHNGGFVNGAAQPGQQEFLLQDAAPGRYMVRVEPGYGYAAAVQYAGTNLLTEPLVLGDGGATSPIDVTMRDDSGQLEGSVISDGGTLPGPSFACLLPLTPGGQLGVATAGPDGRFTLRNLVPGDYQFFAMSKPPWSLPWRDPDFLRSMEGKGTTVSITSKAVLQKDAPMLDEAALELP